MVELHVLVATFFFASALYSYLLGCLIKWRTIAIHRSSQSLSRRCRNPIDPTNMEETLPHFLAEKRFPSNKTKNPAKSSTFTTLCVLNADRKRLRDNATDKPYAQGTKNTQPRPLSGDGLRVKRTRDHEASPPSPCRSTWWRAASPTITNAGPDARAASPSMTKAGVGDSSHPASADGASNGGGLGATSGASTSEIDQHDGGASTNDSSHVEENILPHATLYGVSSGNAAEKKLPPVVSVIRDLAPAAAAAVLHRPPPDPVVNAGGSTGLAPRLVGRPPAPNPGGGSGRGGSRTGARRRGRGRRGGRQGGAQGRRVAEGGGPGLAWQPVAPQPDVTVRGGAVHRRRKPTQVRRSSFE
jgi:hypothetical protein